MRRNLPLLIAYSRLNKSTKIFIKKEEEEEEEEEISQLLTKNLLKVSWTNLHGQYLVLIVLGQPKPSSNLATIKAFYEVCNQNSNY